MFRISIIRVLILAILLAGVAFARHWIAEKSLVSYVESKAIITLKIKNTEFKPINGQLILQGVSVPDPVAPGRELANIDSILVNLDRKEFLRKKYRISSTEIHGIHYKAGSEGSQPMVPGKIWGRFKSQFPNWTVSMLNHEWGSVLVNGFDQNTAKLLEDQFASAKSAREISNKWKTELRPIIEKSQQLNEKIHRIRDAVKNGDKTIRLLDSPEQLRQIATITQDAASLENDLRVLKTQIGSIEKRVGEDVALLRKSYKEDANKISQFKPPRFDQQFFTDVIIGPELNQRFTALLAWAESVREVLNDSSKEQHWLINYPKKYGKKFVFESRKEGPEILISQTLFDGDAVFGNKQVYFLGRLNDVAFSPDQWNKATTVQLCLDSEKPTQAVLNASPLGIEPLEAFAKIEPIFNYQLGATQLKRDILLQMYSKIDGLEYRIDSKKRAELFLPGELPFLFLGSRDAYTDSESASVNDKGGSFEFPLPDEKKSFPRIYVTAILDRREEIPNDKYYIACPQYILPSRTLGNPDELAFSISPGFSQIYATIELDGENIAGRIRLSQFPIRIKPILPQKMRGGTLENRITEVAQRISSLDSELILGGTRDQPKFTLSSDFGEQIAEQLEPIFAQQWNESKKKLETELNSQTEATVQTLRTLFQQQLIPIVDELENVKQQINGSNSDKPLDQTIQSVLGSLVSGDKKTLNDRLETTGKQLLNSAIKEATKENPDAAIKKGLRDALDKLNIK